MKRRIVTHDMGATGIASHMSRYPRRRSGRAILFIAVIILAALALLIGCVTHANGQTRPVNEPAAPAELRPVAFMPQIVQPLPTELDSTGVVTPTPGAPR